VHSQKDLISRVLLGTQVLADFPEIKNVRKQLLVDFLQEQHSTSIIC
jgi:hypothetical protein